MSMSLRKKISEKLLKCITQSRLFYKSARRSHNSLYRSSLPSSLSKKHPLRGCFLARYTEKDIAYSKEMVFAHSTIFELYSSTFSVRVANCTNQNASFVL